MNGNVKWIMGLIGTMFAAIVLMGISGVTEHVSQLQAAQSAANERTAKLEAQMVGIQSSLVRIEAKLDRMDR